MAVSHGISSMSLFTSVTPPLVAHTIAALSSLPLSPLLIRSTPELRGSPHDVVVATSRVQFSISPARLEEKTNGMTKVVSSAATNTPPNEALINAPEAAVNEVLTVTVADCRFCSARKEERDVAPEDARVSAAPEMHV